MQDENIIRLSGAFTVTDSLGRNWNIEGIRIFDEGYGIFDVYVDFADSMQEEALHEDAKVIHQILSQLRSIGYTGPDFGVGAPDLQDDKLIVLEAPEAFGHFAASRGWKNLAEEYATEHQADAPDALDLNDPSTLSIFDALMKRLRG